MPGWTRLSPRRDGESYECGSMRRCLRAAVVSKARSRLARHLNRGEARPLRIDRVDTLMKTPARIAAVCEDLVIDWVTVAAY